MAEVPAEALTPQHLNDVQALGMLLAHRLYDFENGAKLGKAAEEILASDWLASRDARLVAAGRAQAQKIERERDSLARRLGVRLGELEEAHTALQQMRDERDRWQAEVESLTDQLGDMRCRVSAAEAEVDTARAAGRAQAAAVLRAEIDANPVPWRPDDVRNAATRITEGNDHV